MTLIPVSLLPEETSTTAMKSANSSDSRPRQLSLELNSNMASSKEPIPRPLRVPSGYVCPFRKVSDRSLWLNSEENLTIRTCKRQQNKMEVKRLTQMMCVFFILKKDNKLAFRLMSLRGLTLLHYLHIAVFVLSDLTGQPLA